jgi:hypothetical protein
MALVVLSLVIAVILLTLTIYHLRPTKVKRTYTLMERLRKTIGGVVLFAVAWTFLRSDRPELILIALVSIALSTVYVLVERPDEKLI